MYICVCALPPHALLFPDPLPGTEMAHCHSSTMYAAWLTSLSACAAMLLK